MHCYGTSLKYNSVSASGLLSAAYVEKHVLVEINMLENLLANTHFVQHVYSVSGCEQHGTLEFLRMSAVLSLLHDFVIELRSLHLLLFLLVIAIVVID